MLNNILISPSIIATDLSRIGEEVKTFDSNKIDLLHMDVMDGNFVPNLTFGPGFIDDLGKNTDIPFEIHLMIERPEDSVDKYIALKPWGITIHYESTKFPARLLTIIKENGIKAGIALNPATPVENIFDLIPYLDMVLIMSVDPGFYGQKFMETAVGRIKRLNEFLEKNNMQDIIIAVDGGINQENISKVTDAGAKLIIAGSSAFKNGKINENVMNLKKEAGYPT